jgi:hypothetical protein
MAYIHGSLANGVHLCRIHSNKKNHFLAGFMKILDSLLASLSKVKTAISPVGTLNSKVVRKKPLKRKVKPATEESRQDVI